MARTFHNVRSMSLRRLLVVTSLIAAVSGCHDRSTRPIVRISAAADLSAAFEEVGKQFRAKTGIEPQFTFGATGLLAGQIDHGAPVDVFAAADAQFVSDVVKAGRCDGSTVAHYGVGRIVLWSKAGGTLAPTRMEDLTDARFKRIAIANPETAPYGRAAKQALQRLGLWDQLQSRLIIAENVRQALQYEETGNVDVAIVAKSLALTEDHGTMILVPDSAYDLLDQALVVCGNGDGAARGKQFANFIASADGYAILARYGFPRPGGQ